MDYTLPGVRPDEMTALMDGLPIPVLAFLPDGYLAWVNRAALRMFSMERELLLGSRAADLPLRGRLLRGGLVDGGEYEFAADARAARMRASMSCIAGAEAPGAHDVTLVFLTPVESTGARVVSMNRVDAAGRGRGRDSGGARVDPSSGLLDRASIGRALETEVSRSRRYSNPLSVLVAEVDRPHAAASVAAKGDVVAALGRILQEETRWADSIGRWDAHRLALVLPETDSAAAGALVAKLRERVRADPSVQAVRFGHAQWRKGDDATLLQGRAFHSVGIRGSDGTPDPQEETGPSEYSGH